MRFQSICLVAAAAAAAAGMALAGDHPSLAGTWMLDAGNSTGAAPSWSSMTVAEKGHWFRMAQNDKDGRVIREVEGECKADNRFHPVVGGAGGSIKCKWEGPTLTTDQHWNDDRDQRSMRTTLTAGGKLIQDIHETDPAGVKDAHLVWIRQ
jgi:hypothetical protein